MAVPLTDSSRAELPSAFAKNDGLSTVNPEALQPCWSDAAVIDLLEQGEQAVALCLFSH